ncbi:MAG: GNAT family N-acetyltransferase [Methylobacter sp.]
MRYESIENMEIRRFIDNNKEALSAVWEVIFQDDLHNEPAEIVAGYDRHRSWLYAVAVISMYHHGGAGSKLVQYVMHSLKELGCRTVNLQIRSITAEDAAFYKSSCFRLSSPSVVKPFINALWHAHWTKQNAKSQKYSPKI